MSDKTADTLRFSYIELIKRTVTGYDRLGGETRFADFDPMVHYDRQQGAWTIPRTAQPMTLLSKDQLDLLEMLLVDLDARGVAGDCIEAGVWRGGAVAAMRAMLLAHGSNRQIIAADSFAGIPVNRDFLHDPVDLWPDRWEASLDEVRGNIARLGLLDDRIEFLPGAFADSLPRLAGRRFALVRIDADAHDSVMDALTWLYPLLEPGGVVVIDDWHLVGCRFAVSAYRDRHGIADEIITSAGNGYWIKQRAYAEPALPLDLERRLASHKGEPTIPAQGIRARPSS